MLNRIVLMGRLTRDPEIRRTQNGTAVVSFSVACDRDYAAQGAERETDFIDIVAWRGTAEFVEVFQQGAHDRRGRSASNPQLAGQGGQQAPQRRSRCRQRLLWRFQARR